MLDLLRDSAVGFILRRLTGGRLAGHREHQPGFELPPKYQAQQNPEALESASASHSAVSHEKESGANSPATSGPEDDVERAPKNESNNITRDAITVGWYSDDDPDNPHNWSFGKKIYLSVLLLLYTFAAYIGSSIYTTSVLEVTEVFHVSDIAASLGLSLYVLAYSIGPMLWSPLSEIPAVGRNPQYIITFFLFVVLCVPTALVENFAGLLVLRFLLGFFCSPSLATAGASYGDFWGAKEMPYVIALWGGGATLGPALGPVVSGYAVQIKGWRWSTWELLWLSGPVLIFMLFTLPETSSDAILYRRAQRLRKLTGRSDLKSESEIRQAQMSPREITFDALIKPWQINALDPAVLFTTIYTALTYGIYYSFFESFPIVFMDTYGFNLGELGLAFLSVLIGLLCAVAAYISYFYFIADPKFAKAPPGSIQPEARLVPGLWATFFIPVGLFIFAWTARESIHWIVCLIGVAISMFGVWTITQCMFIYLPFTYPRYSGSLFAANGFARGCFAAGSVLYARPMFDTLEISGGVSLLAGLTVLCVVGMYCIYFFGGRLRKRSKFAVS